jgi:nucleoside 2-deoxyribosyltransferase
MITQIYLAGPEVFLANACEIGARKRAICARHGLAGVFPADEEAPPDPAMPPHDCAFAISRAMEAAMRRCGAMIVNLTPFRGVSADVGAAFEMGFMRARGRPIFAYTHDQRPYYDRVAATCRRAPLRRPDGEHDDTDGMAIEDFGQHDNLMLTGGVIASGGCLVAADAPPAERYTSLAAFEQCVVAAAALLTTGIIQEAVMAGRPVPR